jgi:hypothetical protein
MWGKLYDDLKKGPLPWVISLCLITVIGIYVFIVFSGECIDIGMGKIGKCDSLASSLPIGAVVAFDRPGGCPEDWNLFKPGISGVIVGAVELHSDQVPNEDQFGRRLSSRRYQSDGGTEKHKLMVEEMPAHSHLPNHAGHNAWLHGNNADHKIANEYKEKGSVPGWFGRVGHYLPAGSGLPHNNMPPYIALYFCKKDS